MNIFIFVYVYAFVCKMHVRIIQFNLICIMLFNRYIVITLELKIINI